MPYAHRKKRIPRKYDRRIKLTDEHKKTIRELWHKGVPIRQIAREFEGICSRRMIQFVIFPDRAEKARQGFKERKAEGRYKPTKEEWAKTQREHRRYKQSLSKKGLLEDTI